MSCCTGQNYKVFEESLDLSKGIPKQYILKVMIKEKVLLSCKMQSFQVLVRNNEKYVGERNKKYLKNVSNIYKSDACLSSNI